MENYEVVKDLEVGSSCTTRVMKHKETEEVVAMKFIEEGPKMFVYVDREIMKHQWLPHPNIVGLKEINFTKTHLVMVMEYRDEGEPFQKLHYSEKEIYGRMEKYEFVKDLGAGSFGVTKLMRNKHTKELVAMKFIERGPTIDENVEREIINHRSLHHQNIIRFREVILTPTHLALVMEYAAGGELFERVCNSGGFTEDLARYFFQQLISGVNYIHSMQICHRDLKLDNILLDGRAAPRLKICDFGYSKSSMLYSKPNTAVGSATYATPMDPANGKHYGKLYPLHSTPNTNVGSPTYAAPEVLVEGQYDGKMADVWSCGVTLYIMLFAAYPFEDPDDHKNFQKTMTRIKGVYYKIPNDIPISQECRHLLSRIFVKNPMRRISLKEIKSHPWFLKNLPFELKEQIQAIYYRKDCPIFSHQCVEEIMKIVGEARKQLPPSSTTIMHYESKTEEDDETEEEEDEEDGEDDVVEEEEDEEEEDGEADVEEEEEDEEEEDGEDDVEEEEEDDEEEDDEEEDGEDDVHVEEEEEHEEYDMEEEGKDKEQKVEE